VAVEGAGRVFDDLEEGAAGWHLGEDCARRATLARAVVEDDRVGRRGEGLDRDEDAGEVAVDFVPAGWQRGRGPLGSRGTVARGFAVGAGRDQQGDDGHRQADRDRAVAATGASPSVMCGGRVV